MNYQEILDFIKENFKDLKHQDAQVYASAALKIMKANENIGLAEAVRLAMDPVDSGSGNKKDEEEPFMSFKSENDFKEFLAKQINDTVNSIVESKLSKVEGVRQPLVDEVLDEPVTFFTYDYAHTCFADRKNGRVVVAPEVIRFTPSYRYEVGPGSTRDTKIVNLSIFRTQNKSTVDYIRNHTLFNIKYFENITNANQEDALASTLIVGIANSVASLSTHQLISKAKSLSVVMTQDIKKLRESVIRAMVQKELRRNKELGRRIVKENYDAMNAKEASRSAAPIDLTE